MNYKSKIRIPGRDLVEMLRRLPSLNISRYDESYVAYVITEDMIHRLIDKYRFDLLEIRPTNPYSTLGPLRITSLRKFLDLWNFQEYSEEIFNNTVLLQEKLVQRIYIHLRLLRIKDIQEQGPDNPYHIKTISVESSYSSTMNSITILTKINFHED